MRPWKLFAARLVGHVPESLGENREFYFYSLLISVTSLFAHGWFCLLFWGLGVAPMALFNVGSCLVWALVVLGIRKLRLGFSLALAAFEIHAHAWAATLYLGTAASFHFYIILLMVVAALAIYLPVHYRVLVAMFAIVSYVALIIYSTRHSALLPISPRALDWLVAMNSSTFMIILGGQCYFYAVTVHRARRSLAEKNVSLKEAMRHLKEAQEQIVVQQRLAYLGTLTAGVAHEIKNPLNFVKNFATLSADLAPEIRDLAERVVGGKATPDDLADFQECLEHLEQNNKKIEEHCLRADKVVESMLLHSGVSSGELETTDVNALLRASAELAKHDVGNGDAPQVEIVMNLQEDLPEAKIMPRDLGRAFLNILGNAVKAAHDRARENGSGVKPRVVITSRHVEPMIQVRIKDNGAGIPKDLLERIFNPFFTTRPTGEGTGLGLSIAYDIVVGQHSGKLWAESVEGEYAEFCIDFPRLPTGS